jgi:hypothetical protein
MVHKNVGEKRLAVRVDWLGSDASVERDGNDQCDLVSHHQTCVGNVRPSRASPMHSPARTLIDNSTCMGKTRVEIYNHRNLLTA